MLFHNNRLCIMLPLIKQFSLYFFIKLELVVNLPDINYLGLHEFSKRRRSG